MNETAIAFKEREMKNKGRVLTDGENRRAFLKTGMVAASAGVLGAGLLTNVPSILAGQEDEKSGTLTRGDAAILRFLAAAEILETDLWQQYNELALGNAAFQQGLQALDGDMPTYVNQNTRNEFTHQDFINAYLV